MREETLLNIPTQRREEKTGKPKSGRETGSASISLTGGIRAFRRLVNVLLITGFYAAIYFFLTLFFGYSKERFERHTKRWAKRLINSLNIIVTFEGDIPHISYLLIANHRSYIDIPVLYTILPGVFLAKEEVRKWPVLGFAARAAGTVFVRRDNQRSRTKAKEEIVRRIQNGEKIYVFPEGTTSEGPKLLEFRPGIFRLAAENFLPIIPVAVQYADKNDAWLGDDTFVAHFFRTFSKRNIFVRVVFCKPVAGTNAELLRETAYRSVFDNLPDFSDVSCDLETPT